MLAKLKEFFKEVGIILTMIADGSMEDYINDDSEPDYGDTDTGPM